jgi:RNA polymerase sigma factor (sigma-70 family)
VGTRVKPEHDVEAAYREQAARLYHAVLGYSGDPEIARDALAEAFARAMASKERIDTLVPWIWKVAFRVAAEELRRRRKLRPPEEGEVRAPDPPELFEALARLSPRQRAAVVLHYYAGYSLEEIAEILGTRKGTVGVHLHLSPREFPCKARSLSGYSGSPVFVDPSQFFTTEGYTYNFYMQAGIRLLGVDWCHLPRYQPVLESDKETPASEKWYVRENTGLMGVVSAWKLRELLDEEDLVNKRKAGEQKQREARERASQESDAVLEVKSEASRVTRDEFFGDLQ